MPQRPCKPDADMKRLWQTLLPDTPMPACGTGKDHNNADGENNPPKRPTASKTCKARKEGKLFISISGKELTA